MIPRKRTPLSAAQRVEVWRRWRAGESLHAIGRAVGKDHVVVHFLLKRYGGIAPPDRQTLGFRTPADKLQASVATTP